jgi:hypothetical protein
MAYFDSTLLTHALDFPKSCKYVFPSMTIPTLMIPKLAQTSVAFINLTYSIDGGTNWNDTYTRNGMVNAPNLACYFHNESCPVVHPEEVSQASAHAYGELALSTDCGPYNETSDILNSRYDYRYYCRRTSGRQEFAYRYSEYNPKYVQETYSRFTNRIITSSAGPCYEYSEVGFSPGLDTNGNLAAINYEFTNGTFNGNITILMANGALSGTTYIYRGIDIPERATDVSCGPRWTWMWAHKSVGSGEESAFYECPITISPVSNTTTDAQTISDGIARLAASAIGLHGRSALAEGDEFWTQFQFYPFG